MNKYLQECAELLKWYTYGYRLVTKFYLLLEIIFTININVFIIIKLFIGTVYII